MSSEPEMWSPAETVALEFWYCLTPATRQTGVRAIRWMGQGFRAAMLARPHAALFVVHIEGLLGSRMKA